MQPAPFAAGIAAWICAPACGALVGLLAAWLQQYYSPIGIFPLVTGVIIGTIVGGLWRGGGLASRRAVIGSALLAALAAIPMLHYGTYLVAKQKHAVEIERFEEAKRKINLSAQKDQVALDLRMNDDFPDFPEFLHRQWEIGRKLGPRFIQGFALAAWWLGDALLIVAGTILTAAAVARIEPRQKSDSPSQGAA